MKILNKEIGFNSPTYFIADIAANHDGDIERAKDLIWKAAESGADAAKFQHFQAETIVSNKGFMRLGEQLSHQREWKKSVFEVYKDASVDLGWTEELSETCRQANVAFMTTPYNLDIVDDIDKYVPAYKIGSGDITWPELIEKVAKKNKPTFIATGASNIEETKRAVRLLQSINDDIVLMQCNTNYTASLENFKYIKLRVLKTFKEYFPNVILGLSDHTPGCTTVLGSIALGAKVIEKHFTDDCNRSGPDHKFSMTPKTWLEMVERSRELELSLGIDGIKEIEENESESVIVQRRGVYAKHDIRTGDEVNAKNTEVLRPCPLGALTPWDLYNSKKTISNKIIKAGEIITTSDVEYE